MSTFTQKLYTFFLQFIRILSLFLAGLLFLGAILSTCYSTDMGSQLVLTRWDNLPWNLLWSILSAGVIALLSGVLYKRRSSAVPGRLLTAAVLLWYLGAGIILILFSRTAPAADALSVYDAARGLAAGNTGVIHPTDSYLSYYPQQVGLMAFFELLIRIWNLFRIDLHAHHFIKCVYVILTCVSILFQKGIVRLLWKDPRAETIYLLLAGANLPLVMYTSFVYGEIPSFTAVSAGFYFLLKLLSGENKTVRQNIQNGVAALIFLTLSVVLRKNSLILIIAVLITILLEWVRQKRPPLLCYALLCLLLCFSALPLVQKGYELRSGSTLRSGVPAISYLAMGMQESSRGNGWYNGYNLNTYFDTGMDTEKTSELSRQAIRERLEYFREHPAYAADFYLHKHLSQWADGTYASRQATLATFGGRSDFFNSLYEGSLSKFFIEYCNIYQNILYLGVLLFCVFSLKGAGGNSMPEFLGLIGVIGGFLFHIIWEANSRYIFIYGLLLIPYCAQGLSLLFQRINNMFSRSKSL